MPVSCSLSNEFNGTSKVLIMERQLAHFAWSLIFCLMAGMSLAHPCQAAHEPLGIRMTDRATGRGIPLVELTSTTHEKWFTDSAGWVVIDQPDLMGRELHLAIESPGYLAPKDGFGITGQRVKVEPGKKVTISLERQQMAERLYRTTGHGIFRAARRLEIPNLPKEPSTEARIAGCDSVLVARYRNQLHWFWGDTPVLEYPLGNFHMTGANTPLPSEVPPLDQQPPFYHYFVKPDGAVKPMMPMPGDGPTWMGGLFTIRDTTSQERMVAGYSKIRNGLESYRWGLAVWNDGENQFEPLCEFPAGKSFYPISQNHVLQTTTEPEDDRYFYFCQPFPLVRVLKTWDAIQSIDRYESYTCEAAHSTEESPALDRDAHGLLKYEWKSGFKPLTSARLQQWIKLGLLKEQESLIALTDCSTGKPIEVHYGSTSWNPYRKQYITIFSQLHGEKSKDRPASTLGNVWLTEAPSLTGPWSKATLLATHGHYSFYNPLQHPEFSEQKGRIIYFEGTFTKSFSGLTESVPLYEYNQLMYRVDLEHVKAE
ncbi:hypothetical protein [Planctopirus ephydatiae]|nr:hypothetical protein [Planctopirus ephydatiae]